jgi:AraC-like DNA-binding protein
MNAALSLLCVAGCALGMLLVAILLTRHERSRGNLLLASLIAVACIDVLFSAAEHLSRQAAAAALLHFTGFPGLLFAPLSYLYLAAEMLGHRLRLKDTWHFLSFVLLQFLAIVDFAVPTAMHWPNAAPYLNLACVPVIGTYITLGLWATQASPPARAAGSLFPNRIFAATALFAALASYLFDAAARVLIHASDFAAAAIADAVLSCSLIVVACSAICRTVAGKHDTTVCSLTSEAARHTPKCEPPKIKYGNNRLPDFLRESIIAELNEHMRSAQPWLKIDLTLSRLAANINVNPHHLSQIINSQFGKSFACYINEHRLNAACQMLIVESGKAVLDVALDCGFSSKSSFNAVFKKHTGMTPSEYRKKFQKSDCLVA